MTSDPGYSRSWKRAKRADHRELTKRGHRIRNLLLAAFAFGLLVWLIVPGMGANLLNLPEGGIVKRSTDNGLNPDLVAQLDGLTERTWEDARHYKRSSFGDGWADLDGDGCNTRNEILSRDLTDITYRPRTSQCVVNTGVLDDPYKGKTIHFQWGDGTSSLVQIDHIVPLADAWYSGASDWGSEKRIEFANDPLELLAVDGQANYEKAAKTTDQWLPSNKSFHCEYVGRQLAVKSKYGLSVTGQEKSAMRAVLWDCPTLDVSMWG